MNSSTHGLGSHVCRRGASLQAPSGANTSPESSINIHQGWRGNRPHQNGPRAEWHEVRKSQKGRLSYIQILTVQQCRDFDAGSGLTSCHSAKSPFSSATFDFLPLSQIYRWESKADLTGSRQSKKDRVPPTAINSRGWSQRLVRVIRTLTRGHVIRRGSSTPPARPGLGSLQ